jgi:hypothetical protein
MFVASGWSVGVTDLASDIPSLNLPNGAKRYVHVEFLTTRPQINSGHLMRPGLVVNYAVAVASYESRFPM